MDFEASLNFIRTEIENVIQGRPTVPEGFVENFVENESGISTLLNGQAKERLVKHLEEYFWAKGSNGHSLVVDYKSWYPQRKVDSEFTSYYWRRLHKYWIDYTTLPKDAIRATDEVTDEVMDYLGDPNEDGDWDRRGLVMGHVQSGKTTNYSALITKAADAGYRIIIVLAGLTNSLRKQTQERLDMTFAGKSSLGDEVNNEYYPVARVLSGEEGYRFRSPFQGTTQLRDVNINALRSYGAQEGNFADPVLFVTKKHVGVLERLIEWLSSLIEGKKLDGPMLIIDDEADNATVNTTDSETSVTRTNERIRQLLQCARRTSYIGYTATPFANIFIHPESNNEMLGDNLFPKHFIKSLEPPTNYIGARELFSEDGRYREDCIRVIPNDYQDLLPVSHRSTHSVSELPESLIKSVFEFLIFRAIRILDGESDRHSSMMINVSRFNAVQKQIYDLVEDLVDTAGEHAKSWANSPRWEVSEVLKGIHEVWSAEYKTFTGYSWEKIRQNLVPAIIPIEVSLVNMRGKTLDYSSRKEPLHVIAVGGLALARGLTLEGLAVSYVLRNVGAGDTLLQLGRWFGYRLGHESLCRIHLTEEMISHFEEVSESVEELREDLIRMEKLKKAPIEFGLKVRESPTGIAITAANKMRTAEPIRLAADYQEKHVQAYEFYDDADVNHQHFKRIAQFQSHLMRDYKDTYNESNGALIWEGVDASEIADLVRVFDLPQTDFIKMSDSESLLSTYIRDRANSYAGGEKWTVAIPYASNPRGVHGPRINFPLSTISVRAFCRQRFNGVKVESSGNLKATEKNVVADLPFTDLVWGEDLGEIRRQISDLRNSNPDESIKDPRAILNCRRQPILLVHIFQYSTKDNSDISLSAEVPVVSLSLGFTSTEFRPKEKLYAATVRLIEQLREVSQNEEDDDVVVDND
ncbi:Z1 domain-containing protein [Alteromonas facilis]|uniref:Z1 domain-containing protein n=1 Tax=Alteromonas facilis TaxID=2048004 RepID=UPI000C2892C2|nr:Z1 domain-containing protein [Alteromonas facilis]